MTITPGRAIRASCIDCVGLASLVRECAGDKLHDGPCPFYPYRMGKGRPRLRLIRQFCLWCMGNSIKSVRECHTKTCPFHTYRFGRNPKLKGLGGRSWNFKASKQEKGIRTRVGQND